MNYCDNGDTHSIKEVTYESVSLSPSSSSLTNLYDELLKQEKYRVHEDHYDDEDRLAREINRAPRKTRSGENVREYQFWGKLERNQRPRDPKTDP